MKLVATLLRETPDGDFISETVDVPDYLAQSDWGIISYWARNEHDAMLACISDAELMEPTEVVEVDPDDIEAELGPADPANKIAMETRAEIARFFDDSIRPSKC